MSNEPVNIFELQLQSLSKAQFEILGYVLMELSNREISELTHRCLSDVSYHLKRIYHKLLIEGNGKVKRRRVRKWLGIYVNFIRKLSKKDFKEWTEYDNYMYSPFVDVLVKIRGDIQQERELRKKAEEDDGMRFNEFE